MIETLTAMTITGIPEFDIYFSVVFYMGMFALVPSAIIAVIRRG